MSCAAIYDLYISTSFREFSETVRKLLSFTDNYTSVHVRIRSELYVSEFAGVYLCVCMSVCPCIWTATAAQ